MRRRSEHQPRAFDRRARVGVRTRPDPMPGNYLRAEALRAFQPPPADAELARDRSERADRVDRKGGNRAGADNRHILKTSRQIPGAQSGDIAAAAMAYPDAVHDTERLAGAEPVENQNAAGMRQAPCRIVGMICQPVHAGDVLFRECGGNRLKEPAGFRHEREGVGLLCRVASQCGERALASAPLATSASPPAARPPPRGASSSTRTRPVRAAEVMIVDSSSGMTQRKSMTSTKIFSAATRSAAASALRTIPPAATQVR